MIRQPDKAKPKTRTRFTLTLFAVSVFLLLANAHVCLAFALITPEEAALPDKPPSALKGIDNFQTKGNGPTIRVLAPKASDTLRTPLSLDVAFEALPDRTIDYSTLDVEYVKLISINLTRRLRPYLQGNRLIVNDLDVPAGRHRFLVSIAYTSGEKTTVDVVLSVDK